MSDNKMSEPLTDLQKKQKKKKIVIIVIAAMLVFMFAALTLLNYVDFDRLLIHRDDRRSTFVFYPPNYEENIFENAEYLEKNRYIKYTDGPVSVLIIDNDFTEYGRAFELIAQYINAIIHGDAETYASFFSENLKKTIELPEKFTMQKLYDIEIEKLSVTEGEDERGEYRRHIYRISYMIMRNDGTFRSDLGSDEIRPQELTVTERDGKLAITGIATYSYS